MKFLLNNTNTSKLTHKLILFFTIFSMYVGSVSATELKTHSLSGFVQVNSWKSMRDFRVVKQELDYSCGASSLATLLNGFYGFDLSEEDILNIIIIDGAATFENLSFAANSYGFKSGGIILSFDELTKLSIPAIAYVNYRGQDHFTVIRGISKSGNVHVGDPSWGNRKLRPHQFKNMWETMDEDGQPKGKILLVIPQNISKAKMDNSFFTDDVNFRNLTQFIPLSLN